MLILNIGSDPLNTRVLSAMLEAGGYQVIEKPDMAEAQEAASQATFDLVVLMCGTPEAECLERCRECLYDCRIFEQERCLPVIVIGRADNSEIRTRTREAGAVDYIDWPVEPAELLARVAAILRLSAMAERSGKRQQIGPGMELDADRRIARINEREIALSATEFRLLEYLARHAGRVCTRHELLQAVWGWDEATCEREVDVYVSYLRRKLGDDPREPVILSLVRGVGYRFERLR